MFSLAQPTHYPSYDPYEQLLLQQELQRRRQVEAYLRQQHEAEELERRRAYERALLQAEYERRCAAEYERRRRAEVERLRRQAQQERRRSMLGGDTQDLFDAIYGRARSVSPQREEVHKEQNVTEKTAPEAPSTPTPPPASEPTPPQAEAEDVQTEDPTPQIDTAPSLAAVQSVLASFSTLQSGFAFPTRLDFLPASSKLAYTSNNAPLHGYEHALTGLLTQLDAVESFGDDEVRRARKEAVKAIELELGKLDEMRTEAWKNQLAAETESAVSPESDVKSLEPTTALPESESTMEIDPVAVPLPQDCDEDMSVDSPEAAVDSDATPAESSSTTPTQSPISENVPPQPEPLSRSLSSPSPSESSDTESDIDIEDYVEVEDVISASETEAEEEAVEKDEDLELMRDWDLDF